MLSVEPALQGDGIGRKMVVAAEEEARRWGKKIMQIVVLDKQKDLLSWYERQGYKRTGERTPFPADEKFGKPKVAGLQFEILTKPLGG